MLVKKNLYFFFESDQEDLLIAKEELKNMISEQEREKIDREWKEYLAKKEEIQWKDALAKYYTDWDIARSEGKEDYRFGLTDGMIEGYVVGYAHGKRNLKPIYTKKDVGEFQRFNEDDVGKVKDVKGNSA